MVTQYNPGDGLATRRYVQMVSSWCYHCFRKVGGGKIRRLPYEQAIKQRYMSEAKIYLLN